MNVRNAILCVDDAVCGTFNVYCGVYGEVSLVLCDMLIPVVGNGAVHESVEKVEE